VEGSQLGVLDPPAAPQLFDDEQRVEQQSQLLGAEFLGQSQGPQERGVLGDVVRLPAERLR
jgi:hypothetical protein